MTNVSESTRRRLHRQFLIATKQPVFRKANMHQFADGQLCNGSCLTDVHLGLNLSTGLIFTYYYIICWSLLFCILTDFWRYVLLCLDMILKQSME